ncbi:MAG: hypothetical protein EOP33_01150 [Rickettsiaceae bacterium]|nr:MAG: hypothetical protein EOP33_01150 [Rickettsiaceae bacterium]
MSKKNLVVNCQDLNIKINPNNYYFPQSISKNPLPFIKIPMFVTGLSAAVYGLGSAINDTTDYCFNMKYSAVRHTALVVASGLITARAINLKTIDQAKITHDAFLFTASLLGQVAKCTVEDVLSSSNDLVWQVSENVIESMLISASNLFE